VRIGKVIGKLTLNTCDPKLIGGRFLIVRAYEPRPKDQEGSGQAFPLSNGEVAVVYEELGANIGDDVGFSEGREAAMPWYPERVAVDAYLACLLDEVTVEE